MNKSQSLIYLLEGKYDRTIKQIVKGWRDNYSEIKFKDTVEAVDMAFNLAYNGAWGNKVRDMVKDGVEDFQQALTKAIEDTVTENGQLGEGFGYSPSPKEIARIIFRSANFPSKVVKERDLFDLVSRRKPETSDADVTEIVSELSQILRDSGYKIYLNRSGF